MDILKPFLNTLKSGLCHAFKMIKGSTQNMILALIEAVAAVLLIADGGFSSFVIVLVAVLVALYVLGMYNKSDCESDEDINTEESTES